MTNRILVLGHRNPDNDSICSAVGYAHLKNELAKKSGHPENAIYVPARLGPLPPESEWVLKQGKIEPPVPIKSVHARVMDAMTPDPVTISRDATMLEAGKVLRKHNIRSIVVNDDDGQFMGLISTRAIAERYISATDKLKENDPSTTMQVASSLIDSLSQKVSELMMEDVVIFDEEDLLNEAVDKMMSSDLREGVAIDDAGTAVGIMTRSDVATRPRRRVILVDHNEMRQAALGIEEADILEIIDHHRIADVSTSKPIQFINLPVGSTATIIAIEYKRYGIKIPKGIARVLLSAILTDTVILKSPTTTDTDIEIAEYLADIVGTSVVDFGMKVFKTRGGEAEMSIEELVEADSKEFEVGDDVVLIAQHETVDLDGVMKREDEIRKHMRQIRDARNYAFVLYLVTDILAEGSQFIVEGDPKIVNDAFDIECNPEGGNWMPGILSRKKQVAARILN